MKYFLFITMIIMTTVFSLQFYVKLAEAEATVDMGTEKYLEDILDHGNDLEAFDGERNIFFDDDPSDIFETDPAIHTEDTKTSFLTLIVTGTRFTLKHENFYKVQDPVGLMNNRSSARLEVSRPIGRYFFLKLDTKETLYWGSDHRAEAVDKRLITDFFTREAFLQTSFANTSIKAGIQILIWGESEGGAVTDVVSPRDYSEAFFISLEESRIGQLMVLLDQFSPFGDFSFFFVPDAQFNEYPAENTAYEYDIFSDSAAYSVASQNDAKFELGGRWKKSFGQSDVAVMAASLIENDYVYQLDGLADTGEMVLSKHKKRFSMAGIAFNYAQGSFLYKGEIGMKVPLYFNNSAFQIINKDVIDTALGLDYSPSGAYTLSLELVNSHILNWGNDLVDVREDSNSMILVWDKNFLHETLSVNWMTIYTPPDNSFVNILRTAYEFNNHLTFKFEAYLPDISDPENSLWVYRQQKQVAFKIQVQF